MRGKEWNGKKRRRKEWREVKLDFFVWFDINFDKEMNYNFFSLDKFIIYFKY